MSHTPDWPLAILFDAVYATAVLHDFGTQELQDAVTNVWKKSFDPGGIITGADAVITEAQEHYEAAHGPNNLGMLLALPYVLVSLATLRAAKVNAEAAEQRRQVTAE